MVEYWDLLQNVLACWSPAAGITGNILLDRSPNKIHATFSGYQADSWRFNNSSTEKFATLFFGYGSNPGISVATASRSDLLQTNLSVSLWFMYRGSMYQDDFIQVGSSGHYWLWYDRGSIRLDSPGQYGASNIVVSGNSQFAVDSWQNLTFTVQGTSGVLYRNGNQIGSGTLASPTTNTNSFRLFDYLFSGEASESVIWNKTLDIQQVKKYFRLGPMGIGRYLANPKLPKVPYVAQAFSPAWAKRQSQLIGGGLF